MSGQEDPDFGKKCAHSGVALGRDRRYYRNGKYYRNKTAYRAAVKKAKETEAGE